MQWKCKENKLEASYNIKWLRNMFLFLFSICLRTQQEHDLILNLLILTFHENMNAYTCVYTFKTTLCNSSESFCFLSRHSFKIRRKVCSKPQVSRSYVMSIFLYTLEFRCIRTSFLQLILKCDNFCVVIMTFDSRI